MLRKNHQKRNALTTSFDMALDSEVTHNVRIIPAKMAIQNIPLILLPLLILSSNIKAESLVGVLEEGTLSCLSQNDIPAPMNIHEKTQQPPKKFKRQKPVKRKQNISNSIQETDIKNGSPEATKNQPAIITFGLYEKKISHGLIIELLRLEKSGPIARLTLSIENKNNHTFFLKKATLIANGKSHEIEIQHIFLVPPQTELDGTIQFEHEPLRGSSPILILTEQGDKPHDIILDPLPITF